VDDPKPHRRFVKKRTFSLVVALALAPASACSQAQVPPDPQPVAGSTPSVANQYLRPGDMVRLRIWREPDMSGDFPVDETGTVVFPKVGEYKVTEDTPASLQARLLADYQQYLRNPSIEIIVLRRVRITGAVTNPGLQMVDPTVTIADALAAAGGATPLGDPDKIQIIREGKTIAVKVRRDLRITDSPIRSGDQIYVPERSWVSRNSGVVAATITGTVSLVIALFIRH
jgi:polysaccharide biosynthesis/export protein